MTTVIARTDNYVATRAWGGEETGFVLQLDDGGKGMGYILLNQGEARALGRFLLHYANAPGSINEVPDPNDEPMELDILGRLDTLETTLKLLINRVEILAKDVQFTRTLQMETPHDRREA